MKHTIRLSLLIVFAVVTTGMLAWTQESSQETKSTAHPVTWEQMVAKIRAVLTQKADKDMKGLVPAKPEAPASPKFFTLTKAEAVTLAKLGKSDDGKTLQRADMDVPGDIIRVDYSCSAPYDRCGHTYPCDATCGLNQSLVKGHHYTWWTKTDDGNPDVLYTFAVHYSAP
jgi:hypothetical protein